MLGGVNILVPAAVIAFLVQAMIIIFDEFYFHRARFLPRWELVGHPIDTFCLLFFLLTIQTISRDSSMGLPAVIMTGVISCLVITKDEWVHKKHATGTESWLHALLFVIHPVVVGAFFLLWWSSEGAGLMRLATGAVALHFFYQVFEAVRRWPGRVPTRE